MMHKDEIGGNWKQFKGKAKEQWGKLTDDDMEELPSIPGMVPSPSEKLQGCRFAPRCEKCGARCKKEMPELVTLEDGRKVRCFLYEGGVEG